MRTNEEMRLRSRLNLPREHGAWVMLYASFVLGLAVAGKINAAIVLLLIATTAVFVSRESLLIYWRAHKRRRKSQSSAAAARLLLVYFLATAASGIALILVYGLYGILFFAVAGAALLVINAWQAAGLEDRTVTGEAIAIAGLTLTAPAAYYVSSGTLNRTALWLWAVSALYFASSVFYIKLRVTALHARKMDDARRARRQCLSYHSFLLVSLMVMALTRSLSLFVLIAFTPVLVRAFWSLIKPASQLNLKRIGIAEIIYSLIFVVFATLTFKVIVVAVP